MKRIIASIRSKCCNSRVKVLGNTTLYHVCSKCNNACNTYFVERKIWNRNPKTTIQQDKREKIKDKIINKEIKENE